MENQLGGLLHHFSHPHPLELTNNTQFHSSQFPVTCSSCKQHASGWNYTCSSCNYLLHVPCSQMPQRITHPFDQNQHVLSLLSTPPAYPGRSPECNACGNKADGWSYHCGACNIFLHTYCASLPMTLAHHSHAHQLDLAFSPPYPSECFRCNLCSELGYRNRWLYRCDLCGYDVHLHCATTERGQSRPYLVHAPPYHPNQVQAQFPAPAWQLPSHQVQNYPAPVRPYPAAVAAPPLVPYHAPYGYTSAPAPPRGLSPVGQQAYPLWGQFQMGVASGIGQATGQGLVHVLQGGGGDGGSGGASGGDDGGGAGTDFGGLSDLSG